MRTECVQCGKTFTPHRGLRSGRFCGEDCRKIYRKREQNHPDFRRFRKGGPPEKRDIYTTNGGAPCRPPKK